MSNWIKDYFQLPDNWKLEKLEDLTNLIIDGTHHTPTYVDYGVPFLRVTDVQTKDIDKTRLKFVSQKEHKFLIKRCNPEKGDILYSKNGTIGIPKIVDWDWEFSVFVSLALIKLKKGVDPIYVKYLLQSDLIKKQIHRRAKQGTVINLHLEEIRELEIPRSSNGQEKKIVKILTTIDNVIEKTEAAIAKYEAIKQGMMHDLFTRGIGADGQLRPSYADSPELYKESALGWIPKEWEVGKLIDMASDSHYAFTGGPFGSDLKSSDYVKEGVRIIQLQNIGDGEFLNKYKIFTTPRKANALSSCNIFPNDIIIAKMADPVARACIIPNFHERYLMASDGIRLKVDTKRFNTLFCMETINFFDFRGRAVAASTGTTRERIGLTELKNIPFKYPKDKREQDVIADRIKSITDKVMTEKKMVSKQTQLKQGLMQDLLTGKVPVKADLVNA